MDFRKARPLDVGQMKNLLAEHGHNEWNHLPDEGIESEFNLISEDKAGAILAFENKEMVGFSTVLVGHHCPTYLTQYCNREEIGFISNVVVNSQHSGKGIGSELLRRSLSLLAQAAVKEVFIERHEQNLASAGMMRKVGFEQVDTFYDPEKRFSGSRKSSILKHVSFEN